MSQTFTNSQIEHISIHQERYKTAPIQVSKKKILVAPKTVNNNGTGKKFVKHTNIYNSKIA